MVLWTCFGFACELGGAPLDSLEIEARALENATTSSTALAVAITALAALSESPLATASAT